MLPGAELSDLPSFGRYQPLFRIASGGMAEVYGARATGEAGFQRWVAIKRILPELIEDKRFVEMFLDEARLAAMIQSVHVVPTLDLGRASDGSLYLVMDLVVGVTLGNLLLGARRSEETLPVAAVVELVAQAAQGLHDAHEARSQSGEPLHIVHRDVSPRNIMVGLDGRARILDFGIAAGELRSTQTQIGEFKGTQAYFSPEQAALLKVDRRSDLYALGIILWEGLVGERMAKLEPGKRAARIELRRPELGQALGDVVERALVPERGARFQTGEEMALALRAAVGPAALATANKEITRLVRVYGGAIIDRIQAGMRQASGTETTHASPTATPIAGRLRTYGTTFVGREADLERLEEILASHARLITLFGPGGMGKTRLAVELAQRAHHRFPGGVLFCDLAEARSATGVCRALGAVLGMPSMEGGDVGHLVDALAGALASRGRVLVVLDNLEQVIGHIGATLGRWQGIARDATFLATSRERLRLEAETLYELAPLELDSLSTRYAPEEHSSSGVGTRVPRAIAEPSAAARLFIDRALRVRRDLKVDAEAERAIATIVKRLDGLPLAIELAASRVRVMEPVQLLAELSQRLNAPSLGARDANPRQATLDAAIRWSWDLLQKHEQALLACLSVFRGSFDAAAVTRIAAPGSPTAEVEHTLELLVDKSLVRLLAGAPPRFVMLESMREFAGRELDKRRRTAAMTEEHALYYGELAADWDLPNNPDGPRDIERDLENFVQAFRWTCEHGQPDEGTIRQVILLALTIESVIAVRGPASLGKQMLQDAITFSDGHDLAPDLEARLRLGLSRTLLSAGQYDEASAILGEARWVAHLAPTRRAEGWALLTESEWHFARGSLPEALDAAERATGAGAEVGDFVLLARAHFRKGTIVLLRAEHEAAKTAFEHARAFAQAVHYEQLVGRVEVNLAEVAADTGDLAGAQGIAEKALHTAVRTEDSWLEGRALSTLSTLALANDEPLTALELLTRAQQLSHEVGHIPGEGLILSYVAIAHECMGDRADARAALAAAIDANQRANNQLGEGMARVYLGRSHARAAQLQQAQVELAAGVKILRSVKDRVRVVVAMLCGAHLELAKAEQYAAANDAASAEQYRARVRKIIEKTRQDLDGGALRSLDVQHALRLLELDLAPPAR